MIFTKAMLITQPLCNSSNPQRYTGYCKIYEMIYLPEISSHRLISGCFYMYIILKFLSDFMHLKRNFLSY
jgi:hypothetical protein